MKNKINKAKHDNRGVSLIELVIAIAIMAVLTGILAPMFYKYVEKSKKSKDLYTADQIARAVNIAFVDNPDLYDSFLKWTGIKHEVSAVVDGNEERYEVYLVVANDISYGRKTYCFKSQSGGWFGDRDGNTQFCGMVNKELGLSTTNVNSAIIPQYKAKRTEGKVKKNNGQLYPHQEVDRWRICKRKDNNMLEVWVAQPDPYGGYPVYRLWPNPDDEYRQ